MPMPSSPAYRHKAQAGVLLAVYRESDEVLTAEGDILLKATLGTLEKIPVLHE